MGMTDNQLYANMRHPLSSPFAYGDIDTVSEARPPCTPSLTPSSFSTSAPLQYTPSLMSSPLSFPDPSSGLYSSYRHSMVSTSHCYSRVLPESHPLAILKPHETFACSPSVGILLLWMRWRTQRTPTQIPQFKIRPMDRSCARYPFLSVWWLWYPCG